MLQVQTFVSLAAKAMPGVIAVHQRLPIALVVDDLVLVASCSVAGDWVDRVHFLPLR
ncbi:MAG TPA: hypothetical protein VIK01_07450 [Polyangiaceae bacterium]